MKTNKTPLLKKHGFSDDAIIKAVFKDVKCIYEYTVTRSEPEKVDDNNIVRITVASPQEEAHLIEKTYGRNDAELYRYNFVRSYVRSIPQIYQIDLENRLVIKEDFSKEYIPAFHYDEDNEQGLFIRKNYQVILQAVAQWHTAFWGKPRCLWADRS